jgi:transcriptional regulator with XRE-family HTH domain
MKEQEINLTAGVRLRKIRTRLGLTVRDVEQFSEAIADARKSSEYVLSRSWLADIENEVGHVPSLPKVYSLSVIYKCGWTELAKIFGVPIEDLGRDQASFGVPRTHLLPKPDDEDERVTLPLRFRNDPEVQNTNLLYTLAAVWGGVPFSLVRHLNPENTLYGFIGLTDFTLWPLLRPGTFVEIDTSQTKVEPTPPQSEGPFDRPIYFLELRRGFACGWCEIKADQLFLLAHPNSGRETRQFQYPAEVDVVGRVIAVAMVIDKTDSRRRLRR